MSTATSVYTLFFLCSLSGFYARVEASSCTGQRLLNYGHDVHPLVLVHNESRYLWTVPQSRHEAVVHAMRRMTRDWIRAARVVQQECVQQQLHAQQTPKTYEVRVLLASADHGDTVSWMLGSAQSWKIHTAAGSAVGASKSNQIHITVRCGVWCLNNKRYKDDVLHITPLEGHINYGQRSYSGSVILVKDDDTFYLINSLDLEEYICGVLSTESWPGWPLEVNKVLAIACRSYALAMIMRQQSKRLPYHIRNSNYHQTYGGVHDNPIHRAAVEQTRGIFLGYNNEPIIAMFDGCCGGIIPAHIAGTDYTDTPYLARTYACDHCKKCKIYHWRAEYTAHELLAHLKTAAPHMTKLKSVHVAKKDKAGLVKEVKLKGHGKHGASLSGKKLYSLLKEVKSYCFTIAHKGDRITMQGRGFGHHLGLCQWGAREMVRDGKDHLYILPYYYPGTVFMRLN